MAGNHDYLFIVDKRTLMITYTNDVPTHNIPVCVIPLDVYPIKSITLSIIVRHFFRICNRIKTTQICSVNNDEQGTIAPSTDKSHKNYIIAKWSCLSLSRKFLQKPSLPKTHLFYK